jgi:hypothetical protein
MFASGTYLSIFYIKNMLFVFEDIEKLLAIFD